MLSDWSVRPKFRSQLSGSHTLHVVSSEMELALTPLDSRSTLSVGENGILISPHSSSPSTSRNPSSGQVRPFLLSALHPTHLCLPPRTGDFNVVRPYTSPKPYDRPSSDHTSPDLQWHVNWRKLAGTHADEIKAHEELLDGKGSGRRRFRDVWRLINGESTRKYT